MAILEGILNAAHLSVRALLHPTVFGVRAFVENREGQLALIRHSYRSGWFLPGGGVDRGENSMAAAVREAREEVGLTECAQPEFFGLYAQHIGWVTNLVAVYHLREAKLTFRKSFEVREFCWIDPASPPDNTSLGTLRRLAEFTGKTAKLPWW